MVSSIAAPSAPAVDANICSRCSGTNKPGVRYCVTCGNGLDASKGPPVTTTAQLVAPELKAVPRPASVPIAPAAIVRLEAPSLVQPVAAPPTTAAVVPAAIGARAAGERTRICARCKGISDEFAQFCRFCGASLASSPVSSEPTPVPAGTSAGTANPVPQPMAPWRGSSPRALHAVAAQAPAGTTAPHMARQAATVPAAPGPIGVAARADVESHPPLPTPLVPPPVDAAEARRTGAPPAAPPSFGRIVVITKEGGEGATYPLSAQVDIGRSRGDVIIADDGYLSPRHARITLRKGGPTASGALEFGLVDLASTNGIYLRLGREGVREVPLEHQDLFLVGQQVLKFDVVRDAEEGLGPAIEHETLIFGTPTTPRYARISQYTVEGVTRDVFHVQKSETVLGRESGDIVFTDDPFLSRRHAAIKFDSVGRRFVLADLGSSNGTFIKIRGEVTVRHGDQFRIGQQLFRVDLNPAPAP